MENWEQKFNQRANSRVLGEIAPRGPAQQAQNTRRVRALASLDWRHALLVVGICRV
jgi:hypothetical protein